VPSWVELGERPRGAKTRGKERAKESACWREVWQEVKENGAFGPLRWGASRTGQSSSNERKKKVH